MKFGARPIAETEGTILAHSIRFVGGAIRKGTRLTASDIVRLRAAGLNEITVAALDDGDTLEDEAAAALAAAMAGDNVRVGDATTGRVNLYAGLYAGTHGLVRFSPERLVALNMIDEGLTVATLPAFERVAAGRMIATIKIIPYALPANVIERALALVHTAAGDDAFLFVRALMPHRTGLILTSTPNTKPSLIAKRRAVNTRRIEDLGSSVNAVATVAHETAAVAAALSAMAGKDLDPILVFGASAISDRGDVIPAAIVEAGGVIDHFGMPVDPGNLLLLGTLAGRRVIGVPSCATSPKLNGLDWVLERELAGLSVTRADIANMAPGGLLMEISSRPQPREMTQPERTAKPKIAALVLAAGRSTRMGAINKLIEPIAGKAMVRHVVETALAADVVGIRVVTGSRDDEVRDALSGLDVAFTHNPNFAAGLSTSLAAGVEVLGDDIDGVIVLLGDMPLVSADLINRLIGAFDPANDQAICVPVYQGKRGNPILWAARFFPDMARISGDTGARHLIGENSEWIVEVEAGDSAIFRDIDTPEALARLRADRAS